MRVIDIRIARRSEREQGTCRSVINIKRIREKRKSTNFLRFDGCCCRSGVPAKRYNHFFFFFPWPFAYYFACSSPSISTNVCSSFILFADKQNTVSMSTTAVSRESAVDDRERAWSKHRSKSKKRCPSPFSLSLFFSLGYINGKYQNVCFSSSAFINHSCLCLFWSVAVLCTLILLAHPFLFSRCLSLFLYLAWPPTFELTERTYIIPHQTSFHHRLFVRIPWHNWSTMTAVIQSYYPTVYQQPSFYPAQSNPSPYYASPSVQQQQYKSPTTSYVAGSTWGNLPPRRQPRFFREVIMLPTPAPIYRQVRHRLPTPERQVIQRTVVQKANGDVVVQQQRPVYHPRSQSRSETGTKTRSSRSRQVNTDWNGSFFSFLTSFKQSVFQS